MKTNNILTTPFAGMYQLQPLASEAAKWIVNAKLDTTQDKYVGLISGINPVVKTPISDCFLNIKSKKMLDRLYYISLLMDKKANFPEVLTINDIVIDGAYIKGLKDEQYRRAWINISSMLAPPSKSRYAELTVSSSNEVMASVVRGMLCMSYADSSEWLNPTLSSFLISFYTILMKTILDKRYRLDLEESGMAKYAFAYYYASLLNSATDKRGAPILLQKCNRLFTSADGSLDEMAEQMQEIVNGDTVSIVHVVEFIKEHGPNRLNDLTTDLLYKSLSVVSQNSISTWIAADYPPYLVYLLFLSLSGNKHPILNYIINNMFKKQEIQQHVEQLVKYTNLYTGTTRKAV